MKKGDRVRVSARVLAGVGEVPKPGTLGTVNTLVEDGTIIVKLDDGRHALLAVWEVDLVNED
jgi:hypothetical protein